MRYSNLLLTEYARDRCLLAVYPVVPEYSTEESFTLKPVCYTLDTLDTNSPQPNSVIRAAEAVTLGRRRVIVQRSKCSTQYQSSTRTQTQTQTDTAR